MSRSHRTAIASLAAAGALWGLTVPLSKLTLTWFGPAWLATVRFAVMAPVLALIGRRGLRRALDARVGLSGAIGFGLVVLLQNTGIEHTSVTHAAVVIGTAPVLVALIGMGLGTGETRPLTWVGYVLALGGVSLVAGAPSGGSSLSGDLLVFASTALSAGFVVAQPRLLHGRDAAAVTAVQAGAGALVAAPVALATEGMPHVPLHADPLLALLALFTAGTLLPFWLFAHGQARVPAHLAGAYLNLEPVVGAIVGWCAFGDAAAPLQIGGAAAVLAGIVLSTLPGSAAGAQADSYGAVGDPLGAVAVGEATVAARRRRAARLRALGASTGRQVSRAGVHAARRGWEGAPRVIAARRVSAAERRDAHGGRRRAHPGALSVPVARESLWS